MTERRNIRTVLGALTLLPLAACATVTSTPLPRITADDGNAANLVAEGITYFLPRQMAHVKLELESENIATAAQTVATAEGRLTAARTAVIVAESARESARTRIITGSPTQEGRTELLNQRREADGRLAIAQEVSRQRLAAYEDAVKKLREAMDDDTNFAPGSANAEITISLLPPSADHRYAFTLSPRHSILRDDEANITLNRSGLLTSTNVTATDRTGDVVVEIGRLAGAASGRAFGLSQAEDDTDPCAGPPLSNEWIVDFTDSAALLEVNRKLACYGLNLSSEAVNWSYTPTTGEGRAFAARDGVFYRTPAETIISIRRRIDVEVQDDQVDPQAPALPAVAGVGTARPQAVPAARAPVQPAATENDEPPIERWVTARQISLLLPQAGPIAVIEQDAGALTRRNYTLAFDNGILTSYQSTRPGEALAFASLPMRVLTGVFDGLSQVVSLRTGRAEDELGLVNALAELDRAGIGNQTTRNTALLNLLRSQGDLDEGAITNESERVTALLNLLQAQGNLTEGSVSNQTEQAVALLNLLEAQSNLGNGAITSETGRLEALLGQLEAQAALLDGSLSAQERRNQALMALLGSQNQLTLAQIGTPPQLANAQVEAMVQMLTAQSRQARLEACLLAQVEAGRPNEIDICLIAPPTP